MCSNLLKLQLKNLKPLARIADSPELCTFVSTPRRHHSRVALIFLLYEKETCFVHQNLLLKVFVVVEGTKIEEVYFSHKLIP